MGYKVITSMSIDIEAVTLLKKHCRENGMSISSYIETLVFDNLKNPVITTSRKDCLKGHTYSGKLFECPYCRTLQEEQIKQEEEKALTEAKEVEEAKAKADAERLEARKRDAQLKIKRAGLESDLARIEKWLAGVPESETERRAQYITKAQEIREQLLALNGRLGQENKGRQV